MSRFKPSSQDLAEWRMLDDTGNFARPSMRAKVTRFLAFYLPRHTQPLIQRGVCGAKNSAPSHFFCAMNPSSAFLSSWVTHSFAFHLLRHSQNCHSACPERSRRDRCSPTFSHCRILARWAAQWRNPSSTSESRLKT